jgi:hypothetical protein
MHHVKVDMRSYIGPALCSQSPSTFSHNVVKELCEALVIQLYTLTALDLVKALLDKHSFLFTQRQQFQRLS